MLHGAVDVRFHSRVIEGAGQDRHRRRGCPAAADGSFVIATLLAGAAAADEPDDKNHRSDGHLDLQPIRLDMNGKPIAMPVLPFPESCGKAYPYVAISGPARSHSMHFPEIWKVSRT